MHILYIHQYFATRRGGTGTRSYEFARRWVLAGHRVTMLTSQSQLTPEDMQGQAGRRVARFEIEGVDVVALAVPYRQSMGTTARIWSFIRFMLASVRHTLRIRDVDVVYATSTPPTVGVPAMACRFVRHVPFVFEIRDLWPDGPIAIGALKSRVLIGLLRWFERRVYKSASAIVCCAPGPAERVRERSPHGQIIQVVPNCSDTSFFRPDVDGSALRNRLGWNGRFVCLHAGAMGLINGLDLVVRAARTMGDHPEILFALVGEGSHKTKLREQVREHGLDNVQILDQMPKGQIPALLRAADLCLVLVADIPIMEHNSANKFFDAISAGRAVLLNYSGWQRELLEEYRAGAGCRLGDENAFIARIIELKSDPARLEEMGRRARSLAEERFDRDRLSDQVLSRLKEGALSKRRTR
ncbi:MAG: glycosyltransferase family 4 protein [Planctomycetota bacterium]|nr:glycosyltransferase family 4 protein [Planctomycetota bacterium]